MDQNKIVADAVEFVKHKLQDAEGGHDWFHIERVYNNARAIAAGEKVDLFVVELGALLHDIADYKFHGGDESLGPEIARNFLQEKEVPEDIIVHVENIINWISFKGGNEQQQFNSPELQVVQDADRLDALGAIGIARTFNYGGFKGRAIFDPAIPPNMNMSKEEYKKSTAPTINHFYEKLFLLKDRMNTESGKKLAEERHDFMVKYLDQFFREWGLPSHQWDF
ncbi:HD domain-containing protein [Salinimicrobium sp. TH3]|uniref:HD domain-containing protein n=1 Tax=Salinimicrobium sp. TH3 TaxID=2997342 RepID=UPI002275044A|nr:HD domain-containing protein [Salinimicrobium sp. TH3]MCY2686627.1 HD domain-containing protein [Salinimicrobium sp. TH3]